jgi:peptidoglycan hydrolase CwlO-like protein
MYNPPTEHDIILQKRIRADEMKLRIAQVEQELKELKRELNELNKELKRNPGVNMKLRAQDRYI